MMGTIVEEKQVKDFLVAEDDAVTEAGLEQEFDQEYGQVYPQEKWVEIVAAYNGNDPVARNEAGELAYFALFPFIRSIAKKLYESYLPKYGEDLLSEGSLGLCESLRTYDPTKAKPTTWCYRSIVYRMREFVDREVHHTTPHYQANIRKIRDFITAKEAIGEDWTFDDIAVHTGISLTTIMNCITIDRRNRESVSMEQEMADGNATVGDLVPSGSITPEDAYIKKENSEQLYRDMKECLTKEEQEVLALHYGFEDGTQKSAAEISRLTGLKKQDIRRILNTAEYRLRRYMNYKESYAAEKWDRSPFRREAPVSMMRDEDSMAEELDRMLFYDED